MAHTTCPNCEARMNPGDPCPECEHDDGDPKCECQHCLEAAEEMGMAEETDDDE